MKLTALSVVAPAGRRIANGEKRVEVRRWRPDGLPLTDLLIVENDRRLTAPGDVDPNGRAVALVTVAAITDWAPDLAAAACSTWEPGWLAWHLTNIRRIAEPIAVIAARKLYEVECDDALVAAAHQRAR